MIMEIVYQMVRENVLCFEYFSAPVVFYVEWKYVFYYVHFYIIIYNKAKIKFLNACILVDRESCVCLENGCPYVKSLY